MSIASQAWSEAASGLFGGTVFGLASADPILKLINSTSFAVGARRLFLLPGPQRRSHGIEIALGLWLRQRVLDGLPVPAGIDSVKDGQRGANPEREAEEISQHDVVKSAHRQAPPCAERAR